MSNKAFIYDKMFGIRCPPSSSGCLFDIKKAKNPGEEGITLFPRVFCLEICKKHAENHVRQHCQ